MKYERLVKLSELEQTGDRLLTVRRVIDQTRSRWAQKHWTTVEKQLIRQYKQQIMELDYA
jgi:hypothetical protein